MKILSILIFSILTLFLVNGCKSVKETFTLKKKEDVEQFLIKKKNPLVFPPEYESLPKPKKNDTVVVDDKISLDKIMKNSNSSNNKIIKSKNLEKSILNKVKKY